MSQFLSKLFGVPDEEFSVETRDASPSHLLTAIKPFSTLVHRGVETLESTEFEVGGYKWKVIIYPSSGEYISAYLSVAGTASLPALWEVNAIFNFFIYNHISDNYLCFRGKARRFQAIKSEWGFSKLISKTSLREPSNGYICNDKCVFGAEVFVINNQNVSVLDFKDPYKHQWKISDFSRLGNVWKSQDFFAGGYIWRIVLHPNGNSDVYIYLECVDSKSCAPHINVKATCLFCFTDTPHNNHKILSFTVTKDWFTSSSPSWGYHELKAINCDMRHISKGFLVDDCCNLGIELEVQALQQVLKQQVLFETDSKLVVDPLFSRVEDYLN